MGWEIHVAKTAFAAFAEEWDRLNTRLYGGHPFADSRFIGPMVELFTDGSERLCIHRTTDGISAALILRPDRIGRWSTFCPPQRQATILLVEDPRLLETLLAALPGRAWTIQLCAVDPRYTPNLSRLTLPQARYRQAQTIGIRQGPGFREYWEERSSNLIKNIRRYSRRAESERGVSQLSTLVDVASMDMGLERFGALESEGWKGKAGTAVSHDNKQGAFYRQVLRRFASTGQAAVYELYLGNTLASSRLVITNDEMAIILKTTYDESLARFAPGRLLLYRVIEEQFAHPAKRTIEFYTNATRDQRQWSTFACTIENIQIFKNPLHAGAFAFLRAGRQILRRANQGAAEDEELAARVKHVRSISAFEEEQYDMGSFEAADDLAASTAWFEILQENVYSGDSCVRYYFTEEEKRPQVIVPVRLQKKGLLKSIESLSNYYTALYTPLLSRDGDTLDLNDLLAAAVRDHKGAQMMRFEPMSPDSSAYRAILSGLRANNWIPFEFLCFGNWFLKVDGNWEDYLRQRSANLRSALRRKTRRFFLDEGTLAIVTTPGEIEQGIADFQEIYSASWKKPEPYPNFIPALIRQLASRGMLRLGIARLKGRTIAAQLWIVDRKKASIYKVAYHSDFASYSPGTVLTGHLLQHVIEQDRVKEVDFLIGDDPYKRMWMSDRRERWGIVAYNPGTVIGVALLIKEVLGRVLKSLVGRQRLVWRQGLRRIRGENIPDDSHAGNKDKASHRR